jgi:hypothetical protein
MVHQLSFQTLVERYERVNGRVRDLVADKEKAADEAKVINARMDAMQIRMDYFDEKSMRSWRVSQLLLRTGLSRTNTICSCKHSFKCV